MIHRQKMRKFVANGNGINMEKKQKGISTTVRHLTEDAKDITDVNKINVYICKF